MFEFILKNKNLANCYCQFGDGIPLVLMDKSKNRYSRYAQCMTLAGEDTPEGGWPDNNIELCTSYGLTPIAILSQDEERFVDNLQSSSFFFAPPYYIGLHQDSKGNWVWYDDNMKEFSVGNFSFEKKDPF